MRDRRKIVQPGGFLFLDEKQKLNCDQENFRCYCGDKDIEDKMSRESLRNDEAEDREGSCVDGALMKRIIKKDSNEKCNFCEDVRWQKRENLSHHNCLQNNFDKKKKARNLNMFGHYDGKNTNSSAPRKSSKSEICSSFQYGLSGFCTKFYNLAIFWCNVPVRAIEECRGHSPEPLLRVQMEECNFLSPPPRKLRRSHSTARWSLIFCLLALLQCCAVTVASQCDVYASGLDRAGREVGAEYVRCLAGRLVWKYPRNGLRLLLQSPQNGREFRGCIKADPEFDGAQVLVEGKSSLVPLLKAHDHLPLQRERCFSSYEGQVALYLEAAPLPNDQHLSAHTAAFQYDLELLPPGTYYSPDQECRPCSDDELLEAACSSDIVATGRLISVEVESDTSSAAGSFDGSDNSIEDATRSSIDASVLTPSPLSSLGKGPSSIPPSSLSVLRFAAAKISRELSGRDDSVFQKVRGGGVVAPIEVPSHCGMRAGPGTYLLMARMRMGSPKLKCIPRLTYFETLVQKRKSDLQCLLKL